MKIYKITEASEYLGVSINTLKTLNSERNQDVNSKGEKHGSKKLDCEDKGH